MTDKEIYLGLVPVGMIVVAGLIVGHLGSNVVRENLPPPQVVPTTQVQEVKPYYLRWKLPSGSVQLRTGGTAAWRYSNPCKFVYGDNAMAVGSIGTDGRLAIFPTLEAGKAACNALLFQGYASKSLDEGVRALIKKSDKYDPDKFVKAFAAAANVSPSVLLKNVTDTQRAKIIDKWMDLERFLKGNEYTFRDEEDFKAHGW